jgi:hypothetical protein
VRHFLSVETFDDLASVTSMASALIGFIVGGGLKYSL